MDKLNRYYRTIPSVFNPQNNRVINGVLSAWATEDEAILTQIQAGRNQLFVTAAEGKYLNYLGSNIGISRPMWVSLSDQTFRNLIVSMSYSPKQIRKTFYEILDVFYGPLYSRSNVQNLTTETYNFGAPVGLTGTVTFTNNEAVVEGSGTLFLTEVSIGDYVRATSHSNDKFAKVVRVVDNTTLYLAELYLGDDSIGAAKVMTPKVLELKIDNVAQTLVFNPKYFVDTLAVTSAEIETSINAQLEGGIAEVIRDIFSYTNFINIRTNTPGLSGSIEITGGTANAILNFPLGKNTIYTLDQSTVVHEINVNEIIISVPQMVAKLERNLKGALHIKSQYTGTIVSIDNVAKKIVVDLYDTCRLDQFAGTKFGQNEYEFEINSNTAGKYGVILDFDALDDLSVLTGATTIFLSGGATNDWDLTHGLGQQYLNLTMYDLGAGDALIPATLSAIDANNLNITLTDPADLILATQQGTVFNQAVANTTWNIHHAMNQQYVNVTVYDASDNLIIPQTITALDANNMQITFSTAQTGNVVISPDYVFAQSTPLQGWIITHNLSNMYPVVTAYDSLGNVIIPEEISLMDGNRILIVFSTLQTGFVVVNDTPLTSGDSFVIMDPDYPSPYIYDLSQPYRITSYRTHLVDPIVVGDSLTSLLVADSSRMPNQQGFLVIGFGTMAEEQPIPLMGRPNNSSLRIDPSYIFKKNHIVGEMVNFLDEIGPNEVATDGSDYAGYLTGVIEALHEFQAIMSEIKAAGVRLKWDIDVPHYPFYSNYTEDY